MSDTAAPAKPSAGRRRVAAVIGAAASKLDYEINRRAAQWPKKGDAYQGVKPGAWRDGGDLDETRCLPADCPVRPLGYDGENYYFEDTSGQIFCSGDKALGVERMQKLFAGHEDFLCWAWPSWGGRGKDVQVTGFKTEEARRDLFAACWKKGPWSPTDYVRGRGAWRDDRTGELILHAGEHLVLEGEVRKAGGKARLHPTGQLGEYFYVRRPRSILPWAEPVEADDNPAVELVEHFRTWNFVRGDVDVMLLVGWIGVALMGAALDWRPSVFIVGDAGTGKSELHRVLKAILGRAMISTTNATSAGLYQLVGHDALPICIDEIEGEDAPAQAQQIIKMARDAASGSIRIRGGANHQGVEFTARSTFLFSAINPPPLPPASLTRLAVLQLRPLLAHTGRAPVIRAADTIGPRLLRRVVDGWAGWERLYEEYRDVLGRNGHDSRGQNTFGTLLAAAHMLLGDEGMAAARLPFEKLDHWGVMLGAEHAAETAGRQPNWQKCLEELMSSPIDAWNRGERRTVGQILEELEQGGAMFGHARDVLASCDIGLMAQGVVGEGYGLAIPNSSKAINRLLADTSFAGRGSAGSWQWALSQAPEHIVKRKVPLKHGRLDNRVTIGGVQRRCLFVSLADLKAELEGEGDDGSSFTSASPSAGSPRDRRG